MDAEPIDVARWSRRWAADSGATVLFLGRCATTPDKTDRMSPTSNTRSTPELVEPKIREIVEEAGGRWPIPSAVVEHRSGTVSLGRKLGGGGCSTAHREDGAFVAGRFIIDELKTRALIWKKEHWPGGSEWSAGPRGQILDRTGKVRSQPMLSGRL